MRRLQLVLFAFAWATYAYFNQGGGWNQNGRFALTRAIVEEHRLWIDDFVVYASNGPKGSPTLRRLPVTNGGFTDAGRTFALAWWTEDDARTPMAPDAPKDARLAPVDWAAVSGDLAFARGHLHPNKAPGTSLLAVPGYALVYGVERLTGVDPDAAVVMSVNAWLAGVLSVGLLSALGVVVFFRLALRFSDGKLHDALFATLAFAFGTLYFPYATMLYEHDLVAVFLLAAFALSFESKSLYRLLAAGVCAGTAVVSSYLAVLGLAIVAAYVLWRERSLARASSFAAGAVPPLIVLAVYNALCFGTVLTTNYAWQNPLFKHEGSGLAALFTAPRFDVLLALLVSPFRGLFTGSPVLLVGAIGLIVMLRRSRFRAEALVCAAMVLHLLAFNMTFTNWNGGWGCGPRYLIPALPFLALPIAIVSGGQRWIKNALLAVSIAGMSIATIVDPQLPASTTVTWKLSPIWSLELSQLLTGRPGALTATPLPDDYVKRRVEPVSANSGGIYEGTDGRFFALGTQEARLSSFNAGEVLFPGSRLSVVPWLALAALFAALLRRLRSSP